MRRIILVITSIVLVYSSSFGQTTDVTATVNSSVNLVTPLTLTLSSNLSFGLIRCNITGLHSQVRGSGSVTVNPNTGGSASAAGTTVSYSQDNATVWEGPASFLDEGITSAGYTLTGQVNTSYSITISNITSLSGGGGEDMPLSGWKILVYSVGSAVDGETTTGTLDENGQDSFTIGATLTVNANQTGGLYSGTFDVTVDYN